MTRQQAFEQMAHDLGYAFDGDIRIGGNYTSWVIHEKQIWISGQIPRVDNTVVVTGRAGQEVSLAQAQLGAKISAMRALALMRQALGSLDQISKILRISVYVQCSADFTQQSEVADGASAVLFGVLGDAGVHTRTSVGVHQLPKNATVELDLVAAIH